MTPKVRSLSGAALMLVIIPIFAGLLACMPVPVGDPERSRIDPELNGVWAMTEDGEVGGYYLFRPYDKRTWLVIGFKESDADTPKVAIYKAWLTKLGGEKFMTWEPAGGINKDGSFLPEFWFVFRLDKNNPSQVELHILNYEYEGFERIPEPDEHEKNYIRDLRRKFERVIRKNVDDPGMYGDALVLRKLGGDELAAASEQFEKVIEFE